MDATTNVPLPVTNGAVVDQAGKPIVMVSYWQRIACPPGVSIGQPGPQGPAGATGPPGLPAVQVTTTPQYVPGAAVTAGTPSATAPKTTVAPKKAAKRVTRKKVPKPVARAVVTPTVVG